MRLNKIIYRIHQVLEFILEPGEYKKDINYKNGIKTDNRLELEKKCCYICPLKIKCVVGEVEHGNDPQLLPNIDKGPLIYCFAKLKRCNI